MQDTEILVPEDLGSNAVVPEPSAPPAPEPSSDPGKEQTPQPETAERQEPEKAEPDNEDPKDGLSKEEREARRVQQRFDRLTREKWEARRQAEDAQREREKAAEEARYWREFSQKQNNPDQQQPPQFDQKAYEEAVERAAEQRVQMRSFNDNCNRAAASGEKEFPDFTESVGTLNVMGALRPDFLNPVFEVCKEIETEPHQLLYHLGKDPDEAARILRLPAPVVGAALARFASKATAKPPPAPVSNAPAPIKAVSGATRVEPDDSKLSDEAWWEKERKASKG